MRPPKWRKERERGWYKARGGVRKLAASFGAAAVIQICAMPLSLSLLTAVAAV